MISKEEFCQAIALIQQQEETDSKFTKALELVVDGRFVFGTESKCLEAVLHLLTSVFRDTSDWISWWLYEDVEKVIFDGDNEIPVETPEQLYDFLVSEMQEKE
jgi:hypothetical protein